MVVRCHDFKPSSSPELTPGLRGSFTGNDTGTVGGG